MSGRTWYYVRTACRSRLAGMELCYNGAMHQRRLALYTANRTLMSHRNGDSMNLHMHVAPGRSKHTRNLVNLEAVC